MPPKVALMIPIGGAADAPQDRVVIRVVTGFLYR